MPELRDYQAEAVEAVLTADHTGKWGGCEVPSALVSLPTGTGKTHLFPPIAERRAGRALILAHRDELLRQARAKLVEAGVRPEDIGVVKAGRDESDKPVVLASAQTLARQSRRERLLSHGGFSTLIIDEAHHSPAQSYVAIVKAASEASGAALQVVGVTATPGRKKMDGLFGKPVYKRDLLDMISLGWLCDLRGFQIGRTIDLGGVSVREGDYAPGELAGALLAVNAPKSVVDAWREHAVGRQTLCFTPTVEMAHAVGDELSEAGVRAGVVDGSMTMTDRTKILDEYQAGKLEVVVNCSVLTEGVDLPSTSCVVIARPTLSPLLYAQMLGRGTRLSEGKKDCLVLDLVGATSRHRLVALDEGEAPSIKAMAGLHIDLQEGESLLEAVERDTERKRALGELWRRAGKLVSRPVDLIGRLQLHWLTMPTRPQAMVLSAGAEHGQLVLVQHGADLWRLLHIPPHGLIERLLTGSRRDAVEQAERLVRDWDAVPLAEGRWGRRSIFERPSEKQLALLQRFDPALPFGTLTRQQASDMISAELATERLVRAKVAARVGWEAA